MARTTADKRTREKRMVGEMIALYCRRRHVIETKREQRRLEEHA